MRVAVPGQPFQPRGAGVLDETYELDTDVWVEDEDCGCIVARGDFGQGITEIHHWIPDDFAPHVPDGECGCGPVVRENPDGVLLFEHFDQDIDTELVAPTAAVA